MKLYKRLPVDEETPVAFLASYPTRWLLNGEPTAAFVESEYSEEMIAELLAALRFYADTSNWENDVVDIGVGNQEIPDSSRCAIDNGYIAQSLIAKFEATDDAR